MNIWLNDPRDPHAPSDYTQLRHSSSVDLEAMLTPGTDANLRWRSKLNHVAEALKQLQANDVAVLWRPLPEMNNDRFWWGTQASYRSGDPDSAALYINLWRDMYQYFTGEPHFLNNLLWVYSPAEGAELPSNGNTTPTDVPVDWAYPGDNYVDVVGAIVRDDQLIIPDYAALLGLGKPLGLAEFGPLPADQGGQYTHDGSFDVRLYADRLRGSYPYVSYWTSWHSYNVRDYSEEDTDLQSLHALVDNPRYVRELTANTYILSRERIVNNNLRDGATPTSATESGGSSSSSSSD